MPGSSPGRPTTSDLHFCWIPTREANSRFCLVQADDRILGTDTLGVGGVGRFRARGVVFRLGPNGATPVKLGTFILDLALAENGAAATTVGGVWSIWDTKDTERIGERIGPGVYDSSAVALSQSTNQLAIGGIFGSRITVWDYETGSVITTLTGATSETCASWESLAYTNDGSHLLAVDCDNDLSEWDTEDWSATSLPFQDVGTARYGPDDRQRLISLVDGAVIVQDVATGEISQTLLGHSASAELSTDGEILLSSSSDGTVRRWDLRTGVQIGRPITNDARTTMGAALNILITREGDNVLLWDLDDSNWVELACRAAGRNMTRAEWEEFGPRGRAYRATCAQWPIG